MFYVFNEILIIFYWCFIQRNDVLLAIKIRVFFDFNFRFYLKLLAYVLTSLCFTTNCIYNKIKSKIGWFVRWKFNDGVWDGLTIVSWITWITCVAPYTFWFIWVSTVIMSSINSFDLVWSLPRLTNILIYSFWLKPSVINTILNHFFICPQSKTPFFFHKLRHIIWLF